MQQCADYLGIKKRTLADNWRAWGLTGVRVGRALRFRESDVSAWLDANRDRGVL
jgi:excisionase family DNA binding protein